MRFIHGFCGVCSGRGPVVDDRTIVRCDPVEGRVHPLQVLRRQVMLLGIALDSQGPYIH